MIMVVVPATGNDHWEKANHDEAEHRERLAGVRNGAHGGALHLKKRNPCASTPPYTKDARHELRILTSIPYMCLVRTFLSLGW
jgi:hypothetical protein